MNGSRSRPPSRSVFTRGVVINCPTCQIRLSRVRYAGVNLFECEQCHGHLIQKHRVATVRERNHKCVAELAEEITVSKGSDLLKKIRCPRCNNAMDKQKVQDPLTFKADECRNCQFVWLDGGELAKIQIAYEANAQTLEIRKMQTRLANLTPDERAAYEARIAKLVDRGGPLADATRQATIELTFWYYWLGIH